MGPGVGATELADLGPGVGATDLATELAGFGPAVGLVGPDDPAWRVLARLATTAADIFCCELDDASELVESYDTLRLMVRDSEGDDGFGGDVGDSVVEVRGATGAPVDLEGLLGLEEDEDDVSVSSTTSLSVDTI